MHKVQRPFVNNKQHVTLQLYLKPTSMELDEVGATAEIRFLTACLRHECTESGALYHH